MFYAYVHATPDGTPFYVGKGLLRRAREFRRNRNTWYLRVVEKYGEPLVGMFECSSEETAFLLERGVIRCLRRQGTVLTNLTSGGEGMSGWSPNDEYRARMSERMRGRTVSVEARAKIGVAARARRHTEAAKTKQCAVDRAYLHERVGEKHPMFGKRLSAQHVAALVAAHMGKPKRKVPCSICGKLVAVNTLHRWHEANCKRAPRDGSDAGVP